MLISMYCVDDVMLETLRGLGLRWLRDTKLGLSEWGSLPEHRLAGELLFCGPPREVGANDVRGLYGPDFRHIGRTLRRSRQWGCVMRTRWNVRQWNARHDRQHLRLLGLRIDMPCDLRADYVVTHDDVDHYAKFLRPAPFRLRRITDEFWAEVAALRTRPNGRHPRVQ